MDSFTALFDVYFASQGGHSKRNYEEWGFCDFGTIFAPSQDREKKSTSAACIVSSLPKLGLITIAKEKFSLRDASLSRSTSASKVSMSEARYREVKRLRTPLKRGFDIRPNRLAVQTWLTQSGVNTHRGFAMLTVVFLGRNLRLLPVVGYVASPEGDGAEV